MYGYVRVPRRFGGGDWTGPASTHRADSVGSATELQQHTELDGTMCPSGQGRAGCSSMMTHRVVAPRSIASAKCCHLKPSGEHAGLRRTQRTLPIPTEGTAAPACRDAPQGPSHLVSPGSPHWGEPDRPIARHGALPQAATSLLASRCFALHCEPLGAARREPSPRAVPAATARHSGDSTESHRIASAHEHVGHSAGSLQRRAAPSWREGTRRHVLGSTTALSCGTRWWAEAKLEHAVGGLSPAHPTAR